MRLRHKFIYFLLIILQMLFSTAYAVQVHKKSTVHHVVHSSAKKKNHPVKAKPARTRAHARQKTHILSKIVRYKMPELPTSTIDGFDNYPVAIKELVESALLLSKKNLSYQFGSSNPKNGGMDCSGTILYLLNSLTDLEIPRQSSEMYTWLEREGELHHVTSNNLNSAEFADLKPGDLLFWSGTYPTHRNPPITHVMLYLGRKNDQPLMFGASYGRAFNGSTLRGVGVFDFRLPSAREKAKFVGYSCIPEINC